MARVGVLAPQSASDLSGTAHMMNRFKMTGYVDKEIPVSPLVGDQRFIPMQFSSQSP